MLVSYESLGVHGAGLKSPHWVNEVLFSVLWERGCPETGVGHLTLKNASLNPDITWLPEWGPSWESRYPLSGCGQGIWWGEGRMGRRTGEERRGALGAPPGFMPQLFEAGRGTKGVGERGGRLEQNRSVGDAGLALARGPSAWTGSLGTQAWQVPHLESRSGQEEDLSYS